MALGNERVTRILFEDTEAHRKKMLMRKWVEIDVRHLSAQECKASLAGGHQKLGD